MRLVLFGKELHPTIFDKAAAYLFHIICNRPFVDGNKRTGASSALTFLRQNQINIKFSEQRIFILEELIVSTAASKVTKEEIANFFKESYERSD